jgi:hypothetical protein
MLHTLLGHGMSVLSRNSNHVHEQLHANNNDIGTSHESVAGIAASQTDTVRVQRTCPAVSYAAPRS